jgi:hypothetical protein
LSRAYGRCDSMDRAYGGMSNASIVLPGLM